MGNIKVISRKMDDVRKDCCQWASDIKRDYCPDVCVFLEKSGFVFALPMAEVFGCPVVSIGVSRPGNEKKDGIRDKIPYIPQPILALALKSKFMYSFNETNPERIANPSEAFQNAPWDSYKKVLIVDDSVDTGWSVLKAEAITREIAPGSEIKIASYCVIDYSNGRVNVDYKRYDNTIVLTATSRYSKENPRFVAEFDAWKLKNDQLFSA